MSIYDTETLVGVIRPLRKRKAFVLDSFWANYVPPDGNEEVRFDVEDESLGIAPFCSPMVEGRIVNELGYHTKTFRPAYVKEKMALDPRRPLKRAMGEQPTGRLTPQQRAAARMALSFDHLMGRQFRRQELMGIEAITTGKNIISGEGFATQELDYQRKSELTKQLLTTARWGEAGVSPVENHEDWLQEIAEAGGIYPNRTIFDRASFKYYRKDPLFDRQVDITYRGGKDELDRSLAKDVFQSVKVGTIGEGHELWVYNQQYKHPTTGVMTNMIPANTVIMGHTAPEAAQTRFFGTIIDEDLDFEGGMAVDPESGDFLEFAPKTWTTKDPGQRWNMLQSAPLMPLTRPNATGCATVRYAGWTRRRRHKAPPTQPPRLQAGLKPHQQTQEANMADTKKTTAPAAPAGTATYYVRRGQLEQGTGEDRKVFGPGAAIDLDTKTGEELVTKGVLSRKSPSADPASEKRAGLLEGRVAAAEARVVELEAKLAVEVARADGAEAELAKLKAAGGAPTPTSTTPAQT
jgi:hypothetical protein